MNVLVDYEAMLGSEFRPFDPNQGNYTLEASASVRRRRHRDRGRVPPRVAPPERSAEAVRGGVERVRRARAAARRRRRHDRRRRGPMPGRSSQQSYRRLHVDGRRRICWSGVRSTRSRRRLRARRGRALRHRRVGLRARPTERRAGRRRGAARRAGPARSSCSPATSGGWTPIRSTGCRMQWALRGFRLVAVSARR